MVSAGAVPSGWLQLSSLLLACAACSAGATDGMPDYDSAPAFGSGGSTAIAQTQPSTTNPNNATPSPTGANNSETNQTGGLTGNNNGANNSNNGAAGSGGNMGAAGSGSVGAAGSGSVGAAGSGNVGAAGSGNVGAAGSGNVPDLPDPPGAAFFFDDFESGAPGTQPAAWQRWINYTTTAGNALGNPQFALLDASDKYRGNQSVHFHAEAATQPAMLTMRLPQGTNKIYIRAFLKSRIAVGGVPKDSVSNHETLIGLRAVDNDGNDEIRFGGAKGALGFNMVGPGRNDAVAPTMDLWGSAPGLKPNQWQCIEIAFLNDGTPRATATVDGMVVRDVNSPSGWHVPVSQSWLNGLYTEVIIGWQSFSPQPANDVWMDDVVLSQSPIGCN
jgi:hypothetical protein